MKPWCAEGDVPTAANLNLYRGWNSCVGWHCDDEPLFGERSSLCRSASAHRRSSDGRASPVRTVKLASAVLAMLTFLSWMAKLRTSSFTVRIPVWNGNGLKLRFRWIGQHATSCALRTGGGMLPANACARFICSCYGVSGKRWFLVLSGSSLEPCAYGKYLPG